MSQDRIHALAFNALSRSLSMYSRYVPLSEREQITRDVLAAVTPEIRSQVREEILADRQAVADSEGATPRDEHVINAICNGMTRAAHIAQGVS